MNLETRDAEIESIRQRHYPHLRSHIIGGAETDVREDIGDSKVLVGEHADHDQYNGGWEFREYWKPTKEELALLENGAHIELVFFSGILPPHGIKVIV